MPDSSSRPGPPMPTSLVGTPRTRPARQVVHGPQIPTAAIEAPGAHRARRVTAMPGPRRHGASPVQRVALIAVVIALVASAFWLDRNRPAPVAGYGPILQPGGVTVVTGSGLAVGELAPDFRLRTTDGEIVELSSLRGQPVVLHFWTTWCLDCAADLPALQELAGAEGDGVTVLGIDVGEPAGRVQDAAARHGAGYPMLLDRDEAVAAAYGATAYPATVLVDASGVVQAIHQGPISPDELRSQVDDLGAGQ